MPPASSFARTFPRKLQFRIDPAFSPAIPPTDTASSPGSMDPSTFRFRITAPSPTWRNSPCSDPSARIEIPRIVWPCPSNTPEKYGIAAKLLPTRLISFSRITSKSLEFVSTLQFRASASRSSASLITICCARCAARSSSAFCAASISVSDCMPVSDSVSYTARSGRSIVSSAGMVPGAAMPITRDAAMILQTAALPDIFIEYLMPVPPSQDPAALHPLRKADAG